MATDAISPRNDSIPAVGLIGIGLVGTALAERMIAGGLRVIGFDVDETKRPVLEKLGGLASPAPAGVFTICNRVLLSLPHSGVVESVVSGAADLLRPDQVLIDTS